MRACSKRAAFIEIRYLAYAIILLLGAAIALPNFVRARGVRSRNSCTHQTMWIEAAKQVWAAENNKNPDDIPTGEDLKDCMSKITPMWDGRKSLSKLPFDASGQLIPVCPAGGEVTVGPALGPSILHDPGTLGGVELPTILREAN